MSQVSFKSMFWCLTAKKVSERVENTFIWADYFTVETIYTFQVCVHLDKKLIISYK